MCYGHYAIKFGHYLVYYALSVDMAAAVPDGLPLDDVLWWCDCAQCVLSTEQRACHDVSFQTASNLPDYRHAAHAMIYAIHDRVLFDKYRIPADIMVCHRLRNDLLSKNNMSLSLQLFYYSMLTWFV